MLLPLILYCLRQLVPNLWARQAALQCNHNKKCIDFLIPTYTSKGPITLNEIFDPKGNSNLVFQIKLTPTGDLEAGNKIQPIGIRRSLQQPLPYITVHLELGCKVPYRATGSSMMVGSSEPPLPGEFEGLTSDWITARNKLETMRNAQVGKRKLAKQWAAIAQKKAAMDSCNRFSIYVRGASSERYGILREAGIEKEFARMLDIACAVLIDEDDRDQNMRPCERLENTSGHMAWTAEYVVEGPKDGDGEGDSGDGDAIC
jgi:hypothetical protein